MKLYDNLIQNYYFDDAEGILYRKNKNKLEKLVPTGTSKQVTISGTKYKLTELVYLLKHPDYEIGSKRILAVNYDFPTTKTVIEKDVITINNYQKYYYYSETTNTFLRKYSFKGTNKVGTSLKETRNNTGTLTVVLDRDVEVQKATLVWHWYTNNHISASTTRFIFIDGNPDNTRMSNLLLGTTESCTSNNISPIRLNMMFDWDTSGKLIPKYPSKIFQTSGYSILSLFNHTVGVHRILYALYANEPLALKAPEQEIDHINHNRQDNSIQNLRKIPSYLNKRNKSLSKNNTSGHNGIQKAGNKYRVEIASIYLGLFNSLEEAIKVRDNYTKANEYHNNHGLII